LNTLRNLKSPTKTLLSQMTHPFSERVGTSPTPSKKQPVTRGHVFSSPPPPLWQKPFPPPPPKDDGNSFSSLVYPQDEIFFFSPFFSPFTLKFWELFTPSQVEGKDVPFFHQREGRFHKSLFFFPFHLPFPPPNLGTLRLPLSPSNKVRGSSTSSFSLQITYIPILRKGFIFVGGRVL